VKNDSIFLQWNGLAVAVKRLSSESCFVTRAEIILSFRNVCL